MKRPSGQEWDWISAVLLFLLLQAPAARLVTTDWAPFLYWTETLAGFGTVLGLASGASRFRRGTVLVLATGYTLTVLPWQLTRSVKDVYLLDRLGHVGGILLVSFQQFLQRQPVQDPLFFLLFVCLVFWTTGAAAGYWLGRHGRVLAGIILGGAGIIIIQAYGNYQPRGSWWLAVYVFIALLLVGRVHYLNSQKSWTERRVFVNDESGFNILASLFVTIALAILAVWWIPTSASSVQKVSDAWNNTVGPIRERLSNAVTSLRGPYGKPGANFYGSTLAVGQDAATGDLLMFTVDVLRVPASRIRYYWRGRAYNDYFDGTWSASPTSKLLFHPQNIDLGIPDAGDRSQAVFVVTSEFPTQNLIYTTSPPVWVDRPADVAAMRVAPNVYDALSWEARTALSAGSSYEVRAELANPTVEELRTAGEEYPGWVADHYLEVPEEFVFDLSTLANKVAGDRANAFDKAVAITAYLRTDIDYSVSLPAPPEGQDPVMWVLLEHKTGFCNYYASAEVLLLRALGIPARLAVGFAQGEVEDGIYTIHRRDAHAWPEAYFPGVGWVEFEPTANQDPLVRPSGLTQASDTQAGLSASRSPREQQAPIPEEVELAPPSAPVPFAQTRAGRALFTTLLVLAASTLMYLGYRHRLLGRVPVLLLKALGGGDIAAPTWIRSWERWNRLEAVERAFASVNWSLRLLGKSQPTSATAAVRAAALSRLLPGAAREIDMLKDELESGLFTPRAPNIGRARIAGLIILFRAFLRRLDRLGTPLNGRDVYSNPDE